MKQCGPPISFIKMLVCYGIVLVSGGQKFQKDTVKPTGSEAKNLSYILLLDLF